MKSIGKWLWLLFIIAIVSPGTAAGQAKPKPGPFATEAVVEIHSDKGVINLKREEQIAFMFLNSIKSIQDDCKRHAKHICTIDEMVAGPKTKDDWNIPKLKYDPRKTDPNFDYVIGRKGEDWFLTVTPKKPGFGGFYTTSEFMKGTYYNPSGVASDKDVHITQSAIGGELFEEST